MAYYSVHFVGTLFSSIIKNFIFFFLVCSFNVTLFYPFYLIFFTNSERASTTTTANYKDRLKEGANINKSLVTLGNVIKCLGKDIFITVLVV